jgi:ATP-binding protein involved in chromosome partitioning
LLDARKGIEMFRKVEIPVLGIVENMSTHICSSCGHEEAIFGIGGGNEIALEYDTKLLAQLPLSMSIREQGDSGIPTVAADPEGSVSKAYSEIAASIVAAVEATSAETGPVIRIVDD